MGELASRLAAFLRLVRGSGSDSRFTFEELRVPSGQPKVFVGSESGAALWSSPPGRSLLDLMVSDSEYLSAFAGNWDPAAEARMTIAGVVGSWPANGAAPENFAEEAEADLWGSLRREEIVASAVGIVERVQTPPEGIQLPYGRSIINPNWQLMAHAFYGVWPTFALYLPTGPYTLFIARVAVPRRFFGGIAALGFARVSLDLIPDAVWLATGILPRLGHTVAWEEQRFPVNPPQHYPPELPMSLGMGVIDLSGLSVELTEIALRLGALAGSGSRPNIDPVTAATLFTLRSQTDAPVHSADATLALLQAYAAADGSLTDGETESPSIPRRFGWLCGKTNDESRKLRSAFEALYKIRRELAHGRRPADSQISRFLGQDGTPVIGEAHDLWFPVLPWDRSGDAARHRALDMLRRLYRAWLAATLKSRDGQLVPGLSRAQLLGLLRDAQQGDSAALSALRQATGSWA